MPSSEPHQAHLTHSTSALLLHSNQTSVSSLPTWPYALTQPASDKPSNIQVVMDTYQWKSCHLPIELEHKSMWAMKKLKMEWNEAAKQRLNGLNELDEFHLKAYESSSLYKEKVKKYHDQKIEKRDFVVGDLVLLFNSKSRLFPGKLKSK